MNLILNWFTFQHIYFKDLLFQDVIKTLLINCRKYLIELFA